MKKQFVPISTKEQQLFEELSGKNDTLLLLYTIEIEEFIEYYFTYDDINIDGFGLATYYIKVKNVLRSTDIVSNSFAKMYQVLEKGNFSEKSFDQNHTNCFEGSWSTRLRDKNGDDNYILTCFHNIPSGKSSFEFNVDSCNYKGSVNGVVLFPIYKDLVILKITQGIGYFDGIRFHEVSELATGTKIKVLGKANCNIPEPIGEIATSTKHTAKTIAGYSGGAVCSLDNKILAGVHQGDDGMYISAITINQFLNNGKEKYSLA